MRTGLPDTRRISRFLRRRTFRDFLNASTQSVAKSGLSPPIALVVAVVPGEAFDLTTRNNFPARITTGYNDYRPWVCLGPYFLTTPTPDLRLDLGDAPSSTHGKIWGPGPLGRPESGFGWVVNSWGAPRGVVSGGSTRVATEGLLAPAAIKKIWWRGPISSPPPSVAIFWPTRSTRPPNRSHGWQFRTPHNALYRLHRRSLKLAPGEPCSLSNREFRRKPVQPVTCAATTPNLPSMAPGDG